MNKKTTLITVAAVSIILILNFVVKPILNNNAAVGVVKTVLNHWKLGDITKVYVYWLDNKSTPPIYDLLDYKIKDKEFSKKNGMKLAKVTVTMDFEMSNVLPSGRRWIFELNDTRYGWKIIELYPEGQKSDSSVVFDLRERFNKDR